MELVLAKNRTHTARCLYLCIRLTKRMSTENREVSEKLGPQICSGSSHKESGQELEVSHSGDILVKLKTPSIIHE